MTVTLIPVMIAMGAIKKALKITVSTELDSVEEWPYIGKRSIPDWIAS